MAHLNSLFLFEIILKEVKTFGEYKQFIIRSQFADIFVIDLKDPADTVVIVPKRRRISKGKVKQIKEVRAKDKETAESSQSILFSSNVDRLLSHMLQYPMEITLWSKENPQERIGSTYIRWHPEFLQFLAQLYKSEEPTPVVVEDLHNVFDEYTSRRMAYIKLSIKLSSIKELIVTHAGTRPQERKSHSLIPVEGKPCHAVSKAVKKPTASVSGEGIVTVKRISSRGKPKKKNSNKRDLLSKNVKNSDPKLDKEEVTRKISLT